MAKVNFFSQAESFMSDFISGCFSQLQVMHIRKPENEGTSFRE